MLKLVRTHSENPDFKKLVLLLDAVLSALDGDDHSFYAQFNKTNFITEVVVAYESENPVGCGAIKKYDSQTAEVKRMYTLPDFRGKGIAKNILAELEKWAGELEYKNCILETGVKQIDAIGLYQKCGYHIIENYGQYQGVENSICMQKHLIQEI